MYRVYRIGDVLDYPGSWLLVLLIFIVYCVEVSDCINLPNRVTVEYYIRGTMGSMRQVDVEYYTMHHKKSRCCCCCCCYQWWQLADKHGFSALIGSMVVVRRLQDTFEQHDESIGF